VRCSRNTGTLVLAKDFVSGSATECVDREDAVRFKTLS
jgi:hypothetical protein